MPCQRMPKVVKVTAAAAPPRRDTSADRTHGSHKSRSRIGGLTISRLQPEARHGRGSQTNCGQQPTAVVAYSTERALLKWKFLIHCPPRTPLLIPYCGRPWSAVRPCASLMRPPPRTADARCAAELISSSSRSRRGTAACRRRPFCRARARLPCR